MQNRTKPIVVSTLGVNLFDEAMSTLSGLGVENYVIAFDWDAAGKKAIMKAQNALGVKVYYLGGMEEGQDPAEKLKAAVSAIDGFSLRHLMSAAKRTQDKELLVTEWFWRSQIWDGRLPSVQVGRKILIDFNDIETFIKNHKVEN